MDERGFKVTYTGEEVQELLDKAGTAVQTETDPTVPSWAKAEEKPTYTATEVGALPDDTELFSGSYNDLTDKPTIPDSLSDLSEDSTHRLVTDAEKTAWNGKSDFSGSYDDLTDKPTIPAEQIQSDWNQSNTSAKDYIKNKPTIPDISNCITKSPTSGLVKNDGSIDTNTYLTQHQDISNYVQKSNTTGLLKNDGTVDTNTYLTSAPVTSVNGQTGAVSLSIPTESTVSGWGFTKNAGTITGINMNGASKGTSGVVDLGTVITDVSGKQDTLVSGTNIKTINNESLLGSGNITIQGGGGQQQQADWTQTDSTASDFVKNKPSVNNLYYAAWTASSSAAVGTKLTETLVLPEGVYIVRGQVPASSRTTSYSFSLNNCTTASNAKTPSSESYSVFYGQNYAVVFDIIFVGAGGGEVYLRASSSASTTYTGTGGFLTAIKIA